MARSVFEKNLQGRTVNSTSTKIEVEAHSYQYLKNKILYQTPTPQAPNYANPPPLYFLHRIEYHLRIASSHITERTPSFVSQNNTDFIPPSRIIEPRAPFAAEYVNVIMTVEKRSD